MSTLISFLVLIALISINDIGVNGSLNYETSCTCDSFSGNVCTKYTCSTAPPSLKCFPGSSQLILEDGSFKALSAATIGDRVLVNKDNAYEPIIGFIHAKREDLFEFLAIEVQSAGSNLTSTLLVSCNHLIFDFDSGDARFAGKFRVGDRVQMLHNDQILPGEVIKVKLTKQQGFYAPLTKSGTIVVNGVLASNYATVSNHALAHRVMGIYRWWISLFGASASSEHLPWLMEALMSVEKMIRWCSGQVLTGSHIYDGVFEVSTII
ncbi:unnamed protein product [Rotaria socialis]|nr:unnamed protein product [Rotaria socialis]